MKFTAMNMIIFTFFLPLLSAVHSSEILAIFPHTGKSHFLVYEPLVKALAIKGHSVTVVSFFPQNLSLPNYKDINLAGLVPIRVNSVSFDQVDGVFTDLMRISEMGLEACEKVLTFPTFQEVLHPKKKFDVMIVEFFNTNCFLSLSHKLAVPFIGIASASPYPEQEERVGTPYEASFVSHSDLPFDHQMSFHQRLVNVLYSATTRAMKVYYALQEQALVNRLLGDIPSLYRIAHNASLLLVNTHHSMLRARPLTPGYVEIGGVHIQPEKPIPQDLEKFLNDSTKDVLLFSMGSVLQSSSFPAEKRQAFMDAFKELPVTVLMKWESDTLPGKPDNVRLSRWLPQRDLLAHRKVVAFMGHGGLLSSSEAVYCGVPMVLIPMFGDQPNNVAHLVVTGAAVKLDYESITKDNVLKALRAVLFDKSYRENAEGLSERYRDRPMSPLDTAVYWTEYVIRHKGAPHLRSAAVDMPWYQLWLLDVIAFIFTILALVLYVSYWVIKRAFSLCISNKSASQARRKQD